MLSKFAEALLSTPSRSPSVDQLETWAKIAAKRFVEEHVPLNNTIQKIAQDNDLNPNFIERVCEMSNLQTHAALLPKESEKRASFAFPLADPKVVTAALGVPAASGAKMISDFAGPPCGLPQKGPSMGELFGVADNLAGHDGMQLPEKQKLVIVIQKKASERKRVHDVLLKQAMLCETAELEVHKQAKQAIMQGESIEGLYKAACIANLGDIAQETLSKTAQLLNKQFLPGMDKVAFKAPEELIDRDVPVRVINGRNALIAALDTLKRYKDNVHTVQLGLYRIDDELKILNQKIKALD